MTDVQSTNQTDIALGEKGCRVIIRKTSIKEGEQSKTRVGKRKTGKLAKPLAKGHPICFLVYDSKGDTDRNHPARVSSPIQAITPQEDGTLLVETLTSLYRVSRVD